MTDVDGKSRRKIKGKKIIAREVADLCFNYFLSFQRKKKLQEWKSIMSAERRLNE